MKNVECRNEKINPLRLLPKLIRHSVLSNLERIGEKWFVLVWGMLLLFLSACNDMEDKVRLSDFRYLTYALLCAFRRTFQFKQQLVGIYRFAIANCLFRFVSCCKQTRIGRYGKRYGTVRNKIICRGECVEVKLRFEC